MLQSDYVFTTTLDKLPTSKGPSRDNSSILEAIHFQGLLVSETHLKTKTPAQQVLIPKITSIC